MSPNRVVLATIEKRNGEVLMGPALPDDALDTAKMLAESGIRGFVLVEREYVAVETHSAK